MAKRYRKALSILLGVVITIQLTGCDAASTDDFLSSGASEYAAGRPTETLSFVSSEATLDAMIANYSGSYYRPTGRSLSDEEYIDLMRQLYDPNFDLDTDGSEPTGTTSSDGTQPTDNTEESQSTEDPGTSETSAPTPVPQINTVSCYEDFEQIMHYAYDNTLESISFTFVDGYYINLGDYLNFTEDSLERIDPIDVCGVESWSYWYSGNQATIFFYYFYDIDEWIQMKNETRNMVQNVVSLIQPEGKTDYEIVYAVNEYLCDTVYYPDEPYAPVTHTAYGALHDGCAVCEGYACAALLLLEACGVDADYEIGVCTNGEAHGWNLVNVDGVWYQLDVCWNDGGGDRSEYFLVDDAFMHQSRTWDESLYPVCNSSWNAA